MFSPALSDDGKICSSVTESTSQKWYPQFGSTTIDRKTIGRTTVGRSQLGATTIGREDNWSYAELVEKS